MPEHVNVVMAEVAADLREWLLPLAVGAGLQVMTAMMYADVTAVAGPRAGTTSSLSRFGMGLSGVGHLARSSASGAAAAGARGRRLG